MLTAVQLNQASLWRQQTYHWGENPGNGNGKLAAIRVGQTQGATDVMELTYNYNTFDNITSIQESYLGGSPVTNNFTYDSYNRLSSAYGRNYQWYSSGRLQNFAGKSYDYDDPSVGNPYAVRTVDGVERYQYNANGSMTEREMSEQSGSTLNMRWDVQNHLSMTQVNGGSPTAYYIYDPDGLRVKKTYGGEYNYYVNRYYEMIDGTVRKYYYLGGMRVAMQEGGVVTYLHADHLGSTVGTTASGTSANYTYHAFGESRSGTTPPTDYQFTGQKQ